MKYNKIYNENEVVESAVADIAKVANLSDSAVIAEVKKFLAMASVRIAELEVEYNEDGAPFSVADMLEKI